MIHDIQPASRAIAPPCGCRKTPARLGFTDAPALDAAAPDWHWILIAALAALVIFQAIGHQQEKRKK